MICPSGESLKGIEKHKSVICLCSFLWFLLLIKPKQKVSADYLTKAGGHLHYSTINQPRRKRTGSKIVGAAPRPPSALSLPSLSDTKCRRLRRAAGI